MLKEPTILSLPKEFDTEVVANDIGKFFAQKVHNIHANLNNTTVVDHSDDVIVSSLKVLLSDFKELSIDDVKNIIARSTKKSCLLRPMRTSIIMQCADELLPVITLMINLSLQSRFFAGQWKEAYNCVTFLN